VTVALAPTMLTIVHPGTGLHRGLCPQTPEVYRFGARTGGRSESLGWTRLPRLSRRRGDGGQATRPPRDEPPTVSRT